VSRDLPAGRGALTAGATPPEPPLYRPFALLAVGTALGAGVPLGVWMLTRLYWGGGPIPPPWLLLHAHLQIFGLFGVLLVGVAHHLVPRFAGRVVPHRAPVLFRLLAGGLVVRAAGTAVSSPALVAAATLLEAAAFALFAGWLWRSLASPPLALVRRHLAAASGWLVVALLVEAALRGLAMAAGQDGPDPRGMRGAYAMALLGGVGGFMLGVLLRAAPMFVAGWQVPAALAAAAPWTLGLGLVLAVAGEAGGGAPSAVALARLGEAVAVGTIAAAALTGGALGRPGARRSLLARGGPELWLFRLAVLSATMAALGSLAAVAIAWQGIPLGLLADALRHLVTVGFLTSIVVAMAFRLVPAFEGVPVRWPRLRALTFAALVAAVGLRSGEVLADFVWAGILPWLPLSGLLVWLALAAVLGTLLAAVRDTRPASSRSPA
jgi:hypothetical protein